MQENETCICEISLITSTMTSRYRVEYALKTHRRDEFIEWIKALLAVPFVLHSDVENHTEIVTGDEDHDIERELAQDKQIALECRKRYLEIFQDVERLIEHTITVDNLNLPHRSDSRLRKLVPSLGKFFTPLPLVEAFHYEDDRRLISQRRLVSPLFNDVRMILNTAQVLALTKLSQQDEDSRLKLVTFDGDVTLYEDGQSLSPDAPVVSRLVQLLSLDLFVGVVTAAGYPGEQGAKHYYSRLAGLIDRISTDESLTPHQRENLLVMGGETNYLFRYSNEKKNLVFIPAEEWLLPKMVRWDLGNIEYIMATIEHHMKHLRLKFNIQDSTTIIRKERSVGIIPNTGTHILREHLEEIVISCSDRVSEVLSTLYKEPRRSSVVGQSSTTTNTPITNSTATNSTAHTGHDDDIQVCAFNGGSDVWVDIGDKSLGVESLQIYLCKDVKHHKICPIQKSESLHIGDQFASLGANDFKARLSACTVWIANPRETVAILDDLVSRLKASS